MSTRGAIHGLIASAGFGSVKEMPSPIGNRHSLMSQAPTGMQDSSGLAYPAPACRVTASGISGPPKSLALAVAPPDQSSSAPSGLKRESRAVKPIGPSPSAAVAPSA